MHTSRFGFDTMSNLGSKIWKLIPDKIKNVSTLTVFTSKVNVWNIDYCTCRLCKVFVKDLGFVEVESTQMKFHLFIHLFFKYSLKDAFQYFKKFFLIVGTTIHKKKIMQL